MSPLSRPQLLGSTRYGRKLRFPELACLIAAELRQNLTRGPVIRPQAKPWIAAPGKTMSEDRHGIQG